MRESREDDYKGAKVEEMTKNDGERSTKTWMKNRRLSQGNRRKRKRNRRKHKQAGIEVEEVEAGVGKRKTQNSNSKRKHTQRAKKSAKGGGLEGTD